MRTALVEYAGALAVHHQHACIKEDLAAAGLPTDDQCYAHDSVEARRAAFKVITEFAADHYGLPRDPDVEAQLRSAALVEAGLGLDPQAPPVAGAGAHLPVAPATDARYLDAEFVAIYW
jgi:hypothetical protein